MKIKIKRKEVEKRWNEWRRSHPPGDQQPGTPYTLLLSSQGMAPSERRDARALSSFLLAYGYGSSHFHHFMFTVQIWALFGAIYLNHSIFKLFRVKNDGIVREEVQWSELVKSLVWFQNKIFLFDKPIGCLVCLERNTLSDTK